MLPVDAGGVTGGVGGAGVGGGAGIITGFLISIKSVIQYIVAKSPEA